MGKLAMPLAQNAASVSLILASAVTLIALLLGIRQWWERRRREPGLAAEDARHYARQDIRRWMGAVVMVLLAVGVFAGSRVPPRAAGHTNPLFLKIWLVVFLLLFVLLALALLDWVATRIYARRHRRQLTREGIEILREEARRRSFRTNGRVLPRPTGEELPPAE